VTRAVPASLVVVDTDVFSQVFVSTAGTHHRDLRDCLVGRLPVIATQTQAELLSWPRLRKWGESRTRKLDEILAATTVVPVTPEVIEAYVTLQQGDSRPSPVASPPPRMPRVRPVLLR